LIAVSIAVFVTGVLLYALLFLPMLDSSFKLQIQAWIPYLFMFSLAVFAMGGAVEVLKAKL